MDALREQLSQVASQCSSLQQLTDDSTNAVSALVGDFACCSPMPGSAPFEMKQ